MVPVSPKKSSVALDADEATVPLFDGALKPQKENKVRDPLPAPSPKAPLSAPSASTPSSAVTPAKRSFATSEVGGAVVELPVSIDQSCRTQGVLDYYALLNITRDASAEEVRAAYLRFNRLAHPMTTEEGLAHLFQAAQDAYDVLSNNQRRRAYDERLSLITGAVEREVQKGTPLGTFPAVELLDLSWAGRLEEVNHKTVSRPRIVPGGSPQSYGKAVVANAVNLLLSIPDVSSFENIVTPEGEVDYVFLRKGVIVVFSGLVLAEDDREASIRAGLQELFVVSERIRESMPKISPPEIITFAAVLPRCTTYHKQRIVSSFDGKIVPGDLTEVIDEIGNRLLDAHSSFMEGTYRKKLGWLRK